MLERIYLAPDKYNNWQTQNSGQQYLDKLNKINILIGVNNSSKSRFLRTLFNDNDFKFHLKAVDLALLQKTLLNLYNNIDSLFTKNGYADISSQNIPGLKEALKKWVDKLESFDLKSINVVSKDFNLFWNNLIRFSASGGSHLPNIYGTTNFPLMSRSILQEVGKHVEIVESLIPKEIEFEVEKIYIPILRGLRPIQLTGEKAFDGTTDNYYVRTTKDYFGGPNKNLKEQIHTGLSLYDDLKKKLLGKQEDRNAVREFEKFLSKTFFNAEPINLVPSINDDSVHVTIGNEEYPIYDLGDGIQSLIILLYPLFFNKGKNLLVFIEEPENSLHPGLQRLFLETLTKPEFSSFQFFITTHSNHFLDITLELAKISVYTFNKIKSDEEFKFKIENSSNEDLRILDLIGARASSVFLSNCTIWIEGITDRLYLKKYLEVYQEELLKTQKITSLFKEDYNYSFVEYGGGNVVHWSFGDESSWDKIKANKISSKIFLLTDTDNTKEAEDSAKAERLRLLEQKLGKNFRRVNGREIENTLSPKVIIAAIKDLENNNTNELVYQEDLITYEKYKDKKLGEFIQTNFSGINRKYQAKSGTIYPKLEFCRSSIEFINDTNDLSSEGLKIAEDIFNFIKSSNQ